MNPPDEFHGRGGTYVVLPDGRRVPSDPQTGEPLPPADATAEPAAFPDPE